MDEEDFGDEPTLAELEESRLRWMNCAANLRIKLNSLEAKVRAAGLELAFLADSEPDETLRSCMRQLAKEMELK
jgi:hypothetical protein